MALTQELRDRIDDMVHKSRVVLFMKGNRRMPQCGFSATVVGILSDLTGEFDTHDILADADLRAGIKEYADWPTIPQLYIDGEFVGGCDIVRDLDRSGELAKMLGVQQTVEIPQIKVTPAAVAALREALTQESTTEADRLRLSIDPHFAHALNVSPKQEGDVEVGVGELTFVLDKGSARRANGLRLDYSADEANAGFKIDNPNAPPTIRQVSATELKALLDGDKTIRLIDVRTPEERAAAAIAGSERLDAAVEQTLLQLPKDAPLAFYCRSGGRSQRAAERFLELGFVRVYNLSGGITAWARDVDTTLKPV